jgi:hypothetical protein
VVVVVSVLDAIGGAGAGVSTTGAMGAGVSTAGAGAVSTVTTGAGAGVSVTTTVDFACFGMMFTSVFRPVAEALPLPPVELLV